LKLQLIAIQLKLYNANIPTYLPFVRKWSFIGVEK